MEEESVPTVGADTDDEFDASDSDEFILSDEEVLRLARRCASA